MPKKKPSKELVSVEKQLPSVEESHNQKALQHLLLMREIPRPHINEPQEVENACATYFNLCLKNDQKPLVSGLAMVLGITRKRLLDILQGKERSEARETIEEYFGLLEAFDELSLKESKINAVAGIFLAKNNYGYNDGIKIEFASEEEDNETIAKRYQDKAKILKGESVDAHKR